MAESYPSFQGKEPNIDVNLFVNALTQGIAAGNAQKSTFGAAVAGASAGVSAYQQAALNRENIAQERAQTEIDTDPDVIYDRKRKIEADADIAEGQAAEYEEEAGGLSKKIEAKLKRKQAQIKLEDLTNLDDIGAALDDPNTPPEQLTELLKRSTGTFTRNPEEGLGALARARGRVDPGFFDEYKNVITAADQEKRRQNMLQNQAEAQQTELRKKKEDYDEALTGLSSIPGLNKAEKEPGYDYRKLEVYPAAGVVIENGKLKTENGQVVRNTVATGEDKSYVLASGNKVIESYMTPEDARQTQKWINKYKQYGATNNWPVPPDTSPQEAPAGGLRQEGTGLATPAPGPVPEVNQNIVEAARARNEKVAQQAQAQGYGDSYQAMISRGQNIARQATGVPDYIKTPQSVPVTPGTPAISRQLQPTPELSEVPLGSVAYGANHLSNVLGGANVTINTTVHKPDATKDVIDRINAMPAFKDAPAAIKGMAAVESRGRANAVSPVGAAGVMQFMPETGREMGLSDRDRFNPDKAVPASIGYVAKQYTQIENKLKEEFGSQGLSITPDPRMVWAAYNGGFRAIRNGIRAGNNTWEDMTTYIRKNKSRAAAEENITYADKVLMASIPFIKGGNASDDSYIKTLIQFGIIEVGP